MPTAATALVTALQSLETQPPTGEGWETLAQIAAALGVGESTARRRIKRLIANGVRVDCRRVVQATGGHIYYYNLAGPFSTTHRSGS